ncbi:metal ABC transporter substrate-binding protein [Halomicroarcula sp. F28]|uniref:Metal ABC transporter substrate-binding protein n=1 Tax=Haloarcula salinisoli TaxID=2487746 RepID=A0A8J7YFF7_9EURY|nr:metal ABC transporter substrate-binding protein [Halomicroarcula salinisoli]MBX0304477.1 metal ABC transporter substrate-binding protein [Halomicroarcula salinisoli]
MAGLGAIAGCSGGSGQSNAAAVQSSFFVFDDIAENVAGDSTTTDLLVPIGQHGHGWEPGPRVREDIYDASVFVHGMEGFQPWADDILEDLEADGAGVTPVDVSADVSLLEFGVSHDEHDDEHGTESHEGEHHDEHETDTHEREDDNHDHGSMDPHFWMDPTRVATAADTVRAAVADFDADNADSYADNAEAYQARLADLDERMESRLADASKGTLLVAGHNAFGYLSERYGITVEALTDASPDDEPTLSDRERARAVIQEHGLTYICADPLESQTMAEELVAETDAEEVLPLTAMPGLNESWRESDWGYVDVMEQVNLPTLAKALGAR